MRLPKSVFFCLLVTAVLIARYTPPAASASLSGQSGADQSVSILITPTDGKGNPLRELTKDQVSVTDSGQMASILEFKDASDLPLHLGIVLLASKQKFDQQQAAAIDLVQKVMRPGKDKAFVITAAGENPWPNSKLPWLTDPASFADTVRSLDKNTGLRDLFNQKVSTDTASLGRLSLQTIPSTDTFSVFNVIWAMMKTDPTPARRVVVMFRLGSAHAPGYGERVSRATEENHNNVIAAAQALGISIYTIGVEDPLPGGDPSRSSTISQSYQSMHAGGTGNARAYDQNLAHSQDLQYSAGRDNVNRIADATGGHPYWTTKKNYSDAIAGLANELSVCYMVSFAPQQSATPGPIHPIKVQIAGAARVSAPKAYVTQAGK